MAVRDDFSINYEVSPRLVTLTSPSEEITVQDSHDTLSVAQDTPEGQQFEFLVTTSGKEPLGGGTSVGLTTVLNNVQYAFQSTPVIQTGTATTASATFLTDTAATFVTNGVKRGDWIVNFTDQSVTEVLGVISETQIITTGLREGSGNDFGVGDAYKIWQVEEAELSGGNFTAIDDVGADINPLFPVFGRFATKTASASATTQSQEQLEYATFGGGVSWNPAFGTVGTISAELRQ